MVIKPLPLITATALAFTLAGCKGNNNVGGGVYTPPSPSSPTSDGGKEVLSPSERAETDPNSMAPGDWVLGSIGPNGERYSENVPYNPFAVDGGLGFEFPVAINGVHAMTRQARGSSASRVRAEFEVRGDPETLFWPIENSQTKRVLKDASPLVTLFLFNGDWFNNNGRFWSQPTPLKIGSFVLEAPLESNKWTNVIGQNSSAFESFKNSLAHVGVCFGHPQGYSHGMCADRKDASFLLRKFEMIA